MEAVKVANRLRSARELAGLTREQAAVKAGISTTTLQSWESTTPTQIEKLATLARIYGRTVDELSHDAHGASDPDIRVKSRDPRDVLPDARAGATTQQGD